MAQPMTTNEIDTLVRQLSYQNFREARAGLYRALERLKQLEQDLQQLEKQLNFMTYVLNIGPQQANINPALVTHTERGTQIVHKGW